MAGNQAHLFMTFTVVGIIIGMLFDFFRILRRSFKTKDFITYFEDIFFWIITGIIIIYSMYKFSDGELRLFMVIGICMGATMYFFTISKYIIKICVWIINLLRKIIMFPINLIKRLIIIIFKPITIVCINLLKWRRKIIYKIKNFELSHKNVKKSKKDRGFFVKKEKYNSI